MDNQQGLKYNTWNSAQCYVAAGWEGCLGENGYMYTLHPTGQPLEAGGPCILQDSQPLKGHPEPGRLSDILLDSRGYRKPLCIYLNLEPDSC